MTGRLFIVATPIGNLKDITIRALDTLRAADLIACEDTRHSRILLAEYDINRPLTSYFEHSKQKKSRYLLELLRQGKNIALISDAGTPGISDPGYRIIKDCLDNGIEVEAIPGPSAAITALTLSGMPTDRFVFEGFLPNKQAARRRCLKQLISEERTIIVYESPHRLLRALQDIKDVLGDIRLACIREATKKFEEVIRETVSAQIAHFLQHPPKGEFVLVFNLKEKVNR